jgi:hypothetical protein
MGTVEDEVISSNPDNDLNLLHATDEVVNIEDITFETLENKKLAERHIIICGIVENIKCFVLPLRARHLKDPSPIVILHDEPIEPKIWDSLCHFT